MQLNLEDDSDSGLSQALRICIELIRRATVFLFYFLIASIIASAVFFFGKIVWGYLAMFLKAMGEF